MEFMDRIQDGWPDPKVKIISGMQLSKNS